MSEVANTTWRDLASRVIRDALAGVTHLQEAFLANRSRGKARRMVLVEALQLGNRRQLFLVACDEHHFLVGAGNDHVGTLVALPESGARDGFAASPLQAGTHPALKTHVSAKRFERAGIPRQNAESNGARGLQLVRRSGETSCGTVAHAGLEAGRTQ